MQNRTIIIIILLCIAFSIKLSAENKGYIITLQGDTIQGVFKKVVSNRSKVCEFKPFDSDRYSIYLPGTIKSLITGNNFFISERIFYKDEFQDVFLEVILKAKISLYRYSMNRNQEFYLGTSDGNIIGLYNEQKKILLKNNLNSNGIISTSKEYYANYSVYRDILFFVFQDCISVCQRINNLEYDQDSLVRIIKEFLSITEKESAGNTISFEKF